MGLTRVNLLAGLVGAYIIRQPDVELPLGLPYDDEFDRPLVVFDRSFRTDGSIFMNSTGNNPSIHPQWQPEYFGDAIVVNGKVWPYTIVRRRKYRFRIINASNARFFKFYFSNGLRFILVGSDSAYNEKPVTVKEFLLAPSEIADLIVDFSNSNSDSAILCNDAPYPYPSGDPVNEANSKVMKFIIKAGHVLDKSKIPTKLIKYPSPNLSDASVTRECMKKINDAIKCQLDKYARGKKIEVPAHERGWKNVYKMMPGNVTKILVRFSYIHSNAPYPFDATAEPGYVYHCHRSYYSVLEGELQQHIWRQRQYYARKMLFYTLYLHDMYD
ncbi:UNVERIFIED_CONTAM: Multicopper oxidase LPR1 [Sesamum radiatum]|uniref:Multicopper oxidase LPR1 n=1 Tax=Sesamum radiatum TaxID=300843 RepID=A0AAW2VR12_SESRA